MAAKKILIIEDEPDQIMMIKTRLEANGFSVISAMDGEEGIKKVYDDKPDLILLDILIPKMDGFEVCNRIKQEPELEKIPIIVISASGAKHLEENCIAVGADDCIRKPYDSRDLVTKVKKLLGRS